MAETILQQIISGIKTDDKLQQIRELCDKISKEEYDKIVHKKNIPEGPNIFLALEVPGRNKKEVAYLTLERESDDLYLAVLYTIPLVKIPSKDEALRKTRVWQIDDHRPEKILTEYAKTYKYLQGE